MDTQTLLIIIIIVLLIGGGGWPRTLVLARLHQLRGLGDAKVLKSLGHSPKGRHYRG